MSSYCAASCSNACGPCCDPIPKNTPLNIQCYKNSSPRFPPTGPRTFPQLHDALASAQTGDTITLTQDIDQPANYLWTSVQLQPGVTIKGNGFRIGSPDDEARQISAPLLDGFSEAIRGVTVDDLHLYVNITDIAGDHVGAFARRTDSYTIPSPGAGTIRSTFKNCTASGLIYQLENYVGGLVGRADNTTFKCCNNSADITGMQRVGGIAGYIAAGTTVACCTNSGAIRSIVYTKDANCELGGIVGYSLGAETINCVISNCINNGRVSSRNAHVGGIAGYIRYTKILNCTNSAAITGGGDSMAGIVGNANVYCLIAKCVNNGNICNNPLTGTVIPTNILHVAGIAGWLDANGQITRCTNNGVIGKNEEGATCESAGHSGGIVGHIGSNCQILENINNGDVYGGAHLGGIAGHADIVTRSFLTGNVNTASVICTSSRVGGIVGWAYGNVTISTNTVNNRSAEIKGTQYVAGIVGLVGSGDPRNGQTVISNNQVLIGSVTATNAGTSAGVRRIVGRYIKDNSAGAHSTILLLNNYAASFVKLKGNNTALDSVERDDYIAGTNGIAYDNEAVKPDTDPDYGLNRLNGFNKVFPSPPSGGCCGDCQHPTPLYDNTNSQNRTPPPEWTKTLLNPSEHPLLRCPQ